MSDVRARAWETRRAKYGPRGHNGAYSRPNMARERMAQRYIVSLHNDGTLSEGQCCRALKMDRVDFRALCDELCPAL